MKNKTKCLLIIAIFALLLISLTTFSYAKTNLQVSDINVTVTKAKAEITWSKATNADGYDVYVDFPEVGYQFVGTVKNNNVQIIGFDESKTYAVKVKAYKYESGKTTYSDFSPEVKFGFETSSQITTKVGNITRIQATVASNGTYGTVEWNEASNATGYEIYASVGNGSFSYIGEVNSNRITVIGIKENIVYKVQVKPYTTVNGQRIYGSVSDTVVLKYEKEENPELVIKPEKVTGLNVTMDGKNAKLNWNKVSDADGYEVQVKLTGKTDATYETERTNITLSGFSEGYTYVTKVRAYKYVNGEKVYGNYSNSVNIKYEPEVEVDRVTGVEVEVNGSKARISWDRVRHADGYEIDINTPDGIIRTYTTSNTYKNLSGFTDTSDRYSVRVRAYEYVNGKKVYGDYSSRKYFESEYVELDRVTGLKVNVDGDAAKFSWNRVKNADGYEIVINIPGIGDCKYTETDTSRYMTGFTNTTDRYYIKVTAYTYVDGKKKNGDYSSKKYFYGEQEEVDKVTGVVVKRSGSAAKFSWNRVAGADGYEIVIDIPGIGECTYNETATSRYMTGFTETKYKYTIKVRAYEYMNGKKVYGEYTREISF